MATPTTAKPAPVIGSAVGVPPAAVGVGVVPPAPTAGEVTSEVTVEVAEAPVRRFATTTEDAPPSPKPFQRKLNQKTLAEQAAGKAAIAAYYPPAE